MNIPTVSQPSEEAGNTASCQSSQFLPLLILSLSFLIFVIYQITLVSQQRAQLKTAREQLTTLVEQSKPVVAQARQAQQVLEKVAHDLVAIANEDEVAKAVVTKYGIQLSQAPNAQAPQK
jgi:hypothetical protein